ncbi:serine hydrolase [Belliella marina]|uniref:Serine hydrolase n=1 Tax=Belliella marina TaxID=1644146 RepID=A0ABW4VF56_9BACT
MKRILALFLIVLISPFAIAQNEKHDEVAAGFVGNYNAGEFAEIFDLFSVEMKDALPLEKSIAFLSGLKSQFGNINNTEFVQFQNGSYASYKSSFEKGVLLINISLNEKKEINGFLVQPFQEKNITQEKQVSNALIGLPRKDLDLIFNYSKEFPNNTQLSIALIKKGKTQFFGVLIENDSVKNVVNEDKIFEIGSITKVFTATLLAEALEKGDVEIDDKINPIFPFFFRDSIEITFGSLANHTSGLPRLPPNLNSSNFDPQNPYKNYGQEEIEVYLKSELRLTSTPGGVYEYSNLGMGLLGYSLGRKYGKTYQQLLEEKIFDKYKMTKSTIINDFDDKEMVKGLDASGNETQNWEFDVLAGLGGILSTTNEMSNFVLAQFDPNNRELKRSRIPTFTASEQMKLGLGWHLMKLDAQTEVYWHNGGTGGYSSSLVMDVEKENAVIVLSNVSAFNANKQNIDNLAFGLLKSFGTN